jgi:hypothetical protein
MRAQFALADIRFGSAAVRSPHAWREKPFPLTHLRSCRPERTRGFAAMILSREHWLYALAWLLLLALLPWWLGLPLLLAMVAVLLVAADRLHAYASLLRRGLRWGLPGVLFAVQRGLGGDALAWATALVGALAGFTLLAGLEAWLDRAQRTPAAQPELREWPLLAQRPIGPGAALVELQPPAWCDAPCPDPCGGEARWEDGRFRLVDGTLVPRVDPRATFSPDGHWFVARWARGIVLVDCQRQRSYRLRGWDLCGWHDEPWLARGTGPAMSWHEVRGQHGL